MKIRFAGWLFIVIALLLAYGVLAYGIYANVTSRVMGANDYYSRWAGTRALFLNHANPYSEEVTRQIQRGMLGRMARPDEDQVAFAYPLYVAFVAAPFITFSYPIAQALWMAFLTCAIALSVLVSARLYWPRVAPGLVAAALVACVLYYPTVRAVFLGQYAVFSFFCLVLAIYAIDSHQDWLGGLLLAMATVKPQPGILIIPAILIWSIFQSRWRIVGGAVAAGILLVAAGMLFLPTWPLDFIQAVRQYAEYEPVGPPVQIALEFVLPRALAATIASVIAIVLAILFFWLVIRRAGQSWSAFSESLGLAALLTTMIAGRVGSSDQVLLLLPWLQWVGRWLRERRAAWLVSVGFGLVLPWLYFLTSLRGNYEQPSVALVLPAVSLVIFFAQKSPRHELQGVPP